MSIEFKVGDQVTVFQLGSIDRPKMYGYVVGFVQKMSDRHILVKPEFYSLLSTRPHPALDREWECHSKGVVHGWVSHLPGTA